MERPLRFEHSRYLGDKRTQLVYDLDTWSEPAVIDEIVAAEVGATFGPDTLVEAFRHAGAPLESRPFNRLGAVLHLAEVLADAVEHHEGPTEALKLVEPELVEHLHLDLAWLEARIVAAGDVGSEVEALLH